MTSSWQWNVYVSILKKETDQQFNENWIDDHQFASDFLHDSFEINSGHISYLWSFQKYIKTKLGQKIGSICYDLKSLMEPFEEKVLLNFNVLRT